MLQGIKATDRRHKHEQDDGLSWLADPEVDQRAGQEQQVGGLHTAITSAACGDAAAKRISRPPLRLSWGALQNWRPLSGH